VIGLIVESLHAMAIAAKVLIGEAVAAPSWNTPFARYARAAITAPYRRGKTYTFPALAFAAGGAATPVAARYVPRHDA
jgi:hypothetical protein